MSKTKIGLELNISAMLAYIFGWVSGLILFLLEEDDFVRFHAMQSMITFGAFTLLNMMLGTVFIYLAIIGPILHLAGVVLWIFLMVKAYQGEKYQLPVIGEMAEQWAKKLGS